MTNNNTTKIAFIFLALFCHVSIANEDDAILSISAVKDFSAGIDLVNDDWKDSILEISLSNALFAFVAEAYISMSRLLSSPINNHTPSI